MNNSILKSLMILLLSFSVFTADAKTNWVISKQGNGIKVFVRSIPTSPIKSFKGEITIKSSLIPLVAILEDSAALPRWMHETKSAKTLKEVNKSSSYVYVVSEMPWPVMDRDSITLATLTQNKQSKQIQITMKSVPNYIKNQAGLLRIKIMSGKWILTPQGKGTTKVIYEMHVDPGGKLPKWLVNSLSVDMPFYTLNNLRREVKSNKYQQAKRTYILE